MYEKSCDMMRNDTTVPCEEKSHTMTDNLNREMDMLIKLNSLLDDVISTMYGRANEDAPNVPINSMEDMITAVCHVTVQAISKVERIRIGL